MGVTPSVFSDLEKVPWKTPDAPWVRHDGT